MSFGVCFDGLLLIIVELCLYEFHAVVLLWFSGTWWKVFDFDWFPFLVPLIHQMTTNIDLINEWTLSFVDLWTNLCIENYLHIKVTQREREWRISKDIKRYTKMIGYNKETKYKLNYFLYFSSSRFLSCFNFVCRM